MPSQSSQVRPLAIACSPVLMWAGIHSTGGAPAELDPTALADVPAAMNHTRAVADNTEPLPPVLCRPYRRIQFRSGDSLPTRRSAIGPLPLSCRSSPRDAPSRSSQPGVFGVYRRAI
eukprot:5949984-Heterocapsa_arctica.AAC.1